ncbi:MAG: D-aminoacyl-tRNA deacylase, partial [Planctomycetes bacterium]|nr:D-aminoacyl-tRNA deacylase [Planctomycetota bacterium]
MRAVVQRVSDGMVRIDGVAHGRIGDGLLVYLGVGRGDGDADVVSASSTDDKIAWYENNGGSPPTFTEWVISTSANGAVSVFAKDMDGDGDTDVLSASQNDNKIAWYENDGSQRFTPHIITTDAAGAARVFAADVDGDGDMDVLSASKDDGTIAWYENDGNERFTPHVIATDTASPSDVVAVDLDGDGDMDVLEASFSGFAWYENDGSQRFTAHSISRPSERPTSVFPADIDGDGDLDIVVASRFDTKISWYANDGSPEPTFDFGDAPAPYPTLLSAAGAAHNPVGPTLGPDRDDEVDGQPTASADGDGADEDGVTFGSIRVGQLDASVTVNVQNAPAGAKLDAWIDFNGDGSWGGPGEQIFDSAVVSNGDNALSFDVPSWAKFGNTFARFRLSTAGGLAVGGSAADGEVEDYRVTIDSPAGPPRVIDSSIRQGDVRTGGPFVYTVQFSESIAPDGVDIGDVVLIGDTVGAVVATTVAYADGTATLTATFPDLSSDQYTLTVRSSPSGIVDLSGELLDGERHATTTVPSGDGAAGGDFEVNFAVDATPPRVIASSILQNDVVAAGPLLYTVRFDEPLLAST